MRQLMIVSPVILYLMLMRGKTQVYNKIQPKVSFCDKRVNKPQPVC